MRGWYILLVGGLLVGGLLALGTCEMAHAQSTSTQLTLLEAVERALKHSPQVRFGREQVRLRRGVRQAAAGAFDVRFQTSIAGSRQNDLFAEPGASGQSAVVQSAVVNVLRYRVGLAKQFRWGLMVKPYLEMERTHALSSGLAPANRANVGLTITYPLLQGGGAEVVTAAVRAARQAYRASRLALRATVAEMAYQVARAYWGYVAAQKQLGIARASEQRAAILLKETRLLVEAGERPAADLEQLAANLAARTARRIGAEQALLEARYRLGLTIGLGAGAVDTLGVASGTFPPIDDRLVNQLADAAPFIGMALRQRPEMTAAGRRQQAARIRLKAARDELAPRLDLSVGVGYVGLAQSDDVGQFLLPFGAEAGGLNTSITLSTDLSVRNRSARGLVVQREAAYEQRIIAARNLRRTISVNVKTALSALKSNVLQLRKAEQAVALYRTVVENEEKKFRLGMSTLFDVILAEDRLTEARTSYVQSRRRYAEALARLRFETGTLIGFESGDVIVQKERFATVPAQGF